LVVVVVVAMVFELRDFTLARKVLYYLNMP
jgi:hypothetical protein